VGYQVRYCELCGAVIRGKAYRVTIEGVTLTVCERCYSRLMARKARIEAQRPKTAPPVQQRPHVRRPHRRVGRTGGDLYAKYEVVEDYADRVRRARQQLGWSQAVLARKIGEKENTVKRIESGRLMPTIDLARRLEKVLKIKLLEPVVEEEFSSERANTYLTLGDIVRIRGEE